MGCSGLPSTLVARPSCVSTWMPQPAGHSRQVLVYQVGTPGTISSGGTVYGISFSTSLVEHPTVAVAAPAAPTTLRKVGLFLPPAISSPRHPSLGPPHRCRRSL